MSRIYAKNFYWVWVKFSGKAFGDYQRAIHGDTEHFLSLLRANQRLARQSLVLRLRLLHRPAPIELRLTPLEITSHSGPSGFQRRFLLKGCPLVITGLMPNWCWTAPNELRNRIRHDVIFKCCNRNRLARFSQYLSLFYRHPENQVRCSQ